MDKDLMNVLGGALGELSQIESMAEDRPAYTTDPLAAAQQIDATLRANAPIQPQVRVQGEGMDDYYGAAPAQTQIAQEEMVPNYAPAVDQHPRRIDPQNPQQLQFAPNEQITAPPKDDNQNEFNFNPTGNEEFIKVLRDIDLRLANANKERKLQTELLSELVDLIKGEDDQSIE